MYRFTLKAKNEGHKNIHEMSMAIERDTREKVIRDACRILMHEHPKWFNPGGMGGYILAFARAELLSKMGFQVQGYKGQITVEEVTSDEVKA